MKHNLSRLLALSLAATLLLSGCGQTGGSSSTPDATTSTPTQVTAGEYFSDRDLENSYDESACVDITLTGTGAACDSPAVDISGSTVTITGEGTYRLTGTLEDGMVIVDADKTEKVQLVLDGCSIASANSAPIYVRQADKVFVTTAEGSENTLSNAGVFTAIDENNIDAVIWSKDDLTLNGKGALTITSPEGHGVVSKDSLTVTGGTYTVTAASHGLDGKDDVCVTGADVTITVGKDGIHAENDEDTALGYLYIADGSFQISAEGDGLSAGAWLTIDGGTFSVTAGGGYVNGESQASDNWGSFMPGGDPMPGGGQMPGGGGGGGPMPGGGEGGKGRSGQTATTAETNSESTSMKGLKSGGALTVNGGTFLIDSADDALHSNASMTIHSGTLDLSSGDDAVHAEETLTIQSCAMTVATCYEGLEALEIYINGGEFDITATDDGLNASGGNDGSGLTGGRDGMFGGGGFGGGANGLIEINGGSIRILASGDGLDSNGDLTINDGTIVVYNPTAGDTSVLDSQNLPVINGGTYLGLGATTMMAETFSSDSAQAVIACTTGNQSAGSQILITDSQGSELLSLEAEYNFVLMIYSSPALTKGESYHITVGSASGDVEAS